MAERITLKHLVYLIDGTWLFAGQLTYENAYTNIFKLSDRLHYTDDPNTRDDRAGNPQIAHYVRGIGSTKGIRRLSAGGFGFAIDETIQDIYINICSNYRDGDKIYIIGFSRGAIIARAVCELLDFGLLKSSDTKYIEKLWSQFVKFQSKRRDSDSEVLQPAEANDLMQFFNLDFSGVNFLGLFDSVIGGARITKHLQYLKRISEFSPKCVRHTFQIHALDETRPFFLHQPYKGKRAGPDIAERTLEQVWIPGVHADIGGGYDNSVLSDIALLLMIDRMTAHTNLQIEYEDLCDKLLERGGLSPRIHNEYASLKWFWCFPFRQRRKLNKARNSIHPVCIELTKVITKYKGRAPKEYTSPSTDGDTLSPYFISNRLRDKKFCWSS